MQGKNHYQEKRFTNFQLSDRVHFAGARVPRLFQMIVPFVRLYPTSGRKKNNPPLATVAFVSGCRQIKRTQQLDLPPIQPTMQ